MTEISVSEALNLAVQKYVEDSGLAVGMVSGWTLVIAQQAILDENGKTATRILNAASPSLPDFQNLGLLDSAATAYRHRIGQHVEHIG